MKKGKLFKWFAMVIGVCISVLSIGSGAFAKTSETATGDLVVVDNECLILQDNQMADICDSVIKNVTEKYEGIYSFNNFKVYFFNEHEESDNLVVDIEVTVDMTLIRHPQASPFVQGMDQEIQNMTDFAKKNTAIAVRNAYLSQVDQYYMLPVLAGFCYRVYIPNTQAARIDSLALPQFSIFHRVDTEEGEILTEMQENEVFTENRSEGDGKDYIYNAIRVKPDPASVYRITYRPSDAVSYAVEHATDEPEYSAANGNGSDCANFVSKCLFEGGIPKDTDGGYSAGWYPGSLNWIQTGYNGETGVVLYLQKKGYFAPASDSDIIWGGNVMSWNNKSHVAMVTGMDGTSIYYSHHSNVVKENVYYVYDSSVDNVTFHVPKV